MFKREIRVRKIFAISILCILLFIPLSGQDQLVKTIRQLPPDPKKQEAIAFARANGLPIRVVQEDGRIFEIARLSPTGMPMYNVTQNLNSARTISTDKVWEDGGLGLDLDGKGVTVAVWDGGKTRVGHQEFQGRARQVDNASEYSNHSTHVSGTIGAGGVNSSAKGMAYNVSLDCYDWSSDNTEMSTAAASGLLISNHSYGYAQGFEYSSDRSRWEWWGDASISTKEDYKFGFYGQDASDWDQILYENPKYILVKSAGNDRNDGVAPGGTHYVWENGGWTQSSTIRDYDGGSDGYDCLGLRSTVKNGMVVGAVDDIPDGYSSPADVKLASFSSFGPTDDGRIKPDIVANGLSLYSSFSGGDASYGSLGGTSMSSPSIAGAMALLQEHHKELFGESMYAAQLKALVLHTADEAGDYPGPDYRHGWGLMNTATAATFLSGADEESFSYSTLTNSQDVEITFFCRGTEDILVTMAWTDPAGPALPASLNPTTQILVNDLDLELVRELDNQVFQPWVLDPANPAAAATEGDNSLDNVEQVLITDPMPGFYTLRVSHKGRLSGDMQDYALVVSGLDMDYVATGYNEINDNNGALLLTSAGTYLNDMDVQWLLAPENGQPVSLYFSYFGTEETNDVLKIYDGADDSAPLLAELHGTLSDENMLLQSTSGQMYLTFSSNESITAQGFMARFCTVAPEGEYQISGQAHPCVASSESYFALGQEGADFNWSMEGDWYWTEKSNNGIEMEIGDVNGILSLQPHNRCGIGMVSELLISPLNELPEIAQFYGDTVPCENTSAMISVDELAGATYEWVLPVDWTGSSITNEIWFKSTETSGFVKARATNACGSGSEKSMYVDVLEIPGITTILADKIPPCAQNRHYFYVTALPGHSYEWETLGDWSLAGDNKGDTVYVEVGDDQSFMFVNVINRCGEQESSRLFLTSPAPDDPKLSLREEEGAYPELLILNDTELASLRWYLEGVPVADPAGSVNPLMVNVNGNYTVEVFNDEGCSTLLAEGDGVKVDVEDLTVRAYRNASGMLVVENTSEQSISFQIVDLNGKVVYDNTASPGQNLYHVNSRGICILRTTGEEHPGQNIKILL